MTLREAANASDETVRSAKLSEHAPRCGLISTLGAKITGQFQPSPEFVVLFCRDQFLSGALQGDPRSSTAHRRKVCSLRPHAHRSTQSRGVGLAAGIGFQKRRGIADLGASCTTGRHVRGAFGEHGLRSQIRSRHYNKAVGSYGGTLLRRAQIV